MSKNRCRACRHPQRDAIDAELRQRAMGRRRIAQQFGLHEVQIRYHARHVPAALTPEADAAPEAEPTPAATPGSVRAVLRVTYELEFFEEQERTSC